MKVRFFDKERVRRPLVYLEDQNKRFYERDIKQSVEFDYCCELCGLSEKERIGFLAHRGENFAATRRGLKKVRKGALRNYCLVVNYMSDYVSHYFLTDDEVATIMTLAKLNEKDGSITWKVQNYDGAYNDIKVASKNGCWRRVAGGIEVCEIKSALDGICECVCIANWRNPGAVNGD